MRSISLGLVVTGPILTSVPSPKKEEQTRAPKSRVA